MPGGGGTRGHGPGPTGRHAALWWRSPVSDEIHYLAYHMGRHSRHELLNAARPRRVTHVMAGQISPWCECAERASPADSAHACGLDTNTWIAAAAIAAE
jgi:hypothetical protein